MWEIGYPPLSRSLRKLIFVIPSEAELPFFRQFCAVEGPCVSLLRRFERDYSLGKFRFEKWPALSDLAFKIPRASKFFIGPFTHC